MCSAPSTRERRVYLITGWRMLLLTNCKGCTVEDERSDGKYARLQTIIQEQVHAFLGVHGSPAQSERCPFLEHPPSIIPSILPACRSHIVLINRVTRIFLDGSMTKCSQIPSYDEGPQGMDRRCVEASLSFF